MVDLKETFAALRKQILALIELKKQLHSENKDLAATIVRLNKEINQKENVIESLTKQLEAVELKSGEQHSNIILKEQLSDYILELEQCIGWINELN